MSDLAERLVIDPRPISIGRDFEVFGASLDGHRVVVKLVRATDGDAPRAREIALEAEASALAKLAGCHAPALIALTRLANGRLALVREWVEALSLATLIERALVRHRWQGARRWNGATHALVAALCDAVAAVHDAGLVHNDLKPDDVLVRVDDDGRFTVTLIDLGLAAKPGRGGPGGTVAYAAPERLEGDAGTPRSDVWALGAILFELCAGTRAYAADQPVDARLEREHPIERSPRAAVAHAWRALPAILQRALASALAADPRRRPKSVAAFRKLLALDASLAGSRRLGDERVTLAAASPVRSQRPKPGRAASAPLIATAAAATALGVFLAWGPMSRAIGLSRATSTVACAPMNAEAARLCHGQPDCLRALTATDDCDARLRLLSSCEAP